VGIAHAGDAHAELMGYTSAVFRPGQRVDTSLGGVVAGQRQPRGAVR